MGQGRTIGKDTTHSEVTGLNCDGNPFEANHEGMMGSGGEGIHSKRSMYANRVEGEVLDVEMSREG